MGRFDRFKGTNPEVVIDGEKYPVNLKVKDAEIFLSIQENGKIDERVSDMMIDALHRANKDEPREAIESFVAQNYTQLLTEFAIAFKFVKREDVEK